jgi:hypothetical protein
VALALEPHQQPDGHAREEGEEDDARFGHAIFQRRTIRRRRPARDRFRRFVLREY